MSQLFKFQEIQTKYKQNTNKIQNTKYKKNEIVHFDEIHQREVSKSPSQKCSQISQNDENDTFYQTFILYKFVSIKQRLKYYINIIGKNIQK